MNRDLVYRLLDVFLDMIGAGTVFIIVLFVVPVVRMGYVSLGAGVLCIISLVFIAIMLIYRSLDRFYGVIRLYLGKRILSLSVVLAAVVPALVVCMLYYVNTFYVFIVAPDIYALKSNLNNIANGIVAIFAGPGIAVAMTMLIMLIHCLLRLLKSDSN